MTTPGKNPFDRIETLLGDLERTCDERSVDTARAIVTTLLDVHADGFSRMLGRIAEAGPVGQALLGAFGRDDLLGSLLLLHGLHPEPLEARLRRGLDAARADLAAHGAGVELVGIQKGVVTVRLKGAPHDQPPFLRRAIEDAIVAVAPDVDRLEIVEGPSHGGHEVPSALIPAHRLVRTGTRDVNGDGHA
ncbi:MAG TPA: hypothetical protein VJT73_11565 [Polyangiaceae bacterium]|nr:hypothetical protein [Polyangiaceae bacterium]